MKKSTFMLSALFLFLVSSCSVENTNNEETSVNPNFRVYDYSPKGGSNGYVGSLRTAEGEAFCYQTRLMAGQHHDAGTVTVTNDGENLIITYLTNEDWTIEATHMSIGDCDEQEIPTTGSGNPKVGRFEHSSEHPEGTNEVVYMISLEAIADSYCFAAHAEVTGPTGGETAWGEGTSFDGNSWAMFIEALLSDCAFEESQPDME